MPKLFTYSRLVREQCTINNMLAKAKAEKKSVLCSRLRAYRDTLARLSIQKGDIERLLGKENV